MSSTLGKRLFHSDESESRIVIYRSYFERLLVVPKPVRDQLMIELPTLQGFRTGEVSSFRVEYIDFERGDLKVLDSKKHKLFMIPLDLMVAQHLEQYTSEKGLTEGFLLRSNRKRKQGNKSKGAGLTLSAIQHVWDKWCLAAGIPIMSPRMGRAYFAANWHFVERKSLYGLMTILRHYDILATQKYLAKIVDYLSVKGEFYQGRKSPFVSECSRSDKCPVAAEGCRCRMYSPNLEVHQIER